MNTAHATELYARATPGFAARLAEATELLVRRAGAHPGRVVQASSLGAEDQVVTDLMARLRVPVTVATLDTGKLHAETLALIASTEQRYSIVVERHRPASEAVLAFVARNGEDAMFRSIELRKACCAMRKVEPLGRMLAGCDMWITGLRREQSAERGAIEVEGLDDAGRVKLNPLADWSWADVWHYIALHELPYNALHDRFFSSIGCAPCTRAVALGEDARAGRWWWESGVKECGLHVAPASADVEAPA